MTQYSGTIQKKAAINGTFYLEKRAEFSVSNLQNCSRWPAN
jgi:hypothetical protein